VAKRLELELSKLLSPMKFTKRHMMHVRQIVLAQRRLSGPPVTKRLRRMMERDYAAHALDLKELISETEKDEQVLGEWLKVFAERKNDNRRRPPHSDGKKRSSRRRSTGKPDEKPDEKAERSQRKPRRGPPPKKRKENAESKNKSGINSKINS
jgi:hypothetical protein